MADVRSTQLAIGKDTTTGSLVTVYTVPANRRTIIRSIVFLNDATTAGYCHWAIKHGGVDDYFLMVDSLAVRATQTFTPWIVMSAGQELRLLHQRTDLRYLVSGAELVLP